MTQTLEAPLTGTIEREDVEATLDRDSFENDEQYDQAVDNLHRGALQNIAWRQSRPLEEQIAMINDPIISPAESEPVEAEYPEDPEAETDRGE